MVIYVYFACLDLISFRMSSARLALSPFDGVVDTLGVVDSSLIGFSTGSTVLVTFSVTVLVSVTGLDPFDVAVYATPAGL